MVVSESAVTERRRLFDPRRPRFALQLAILAFVVVVHSDASRAAVGAVIALIGLVVGNLIENRWFWWATAGLMTVWFFLEWPLLDNHVALSVYWAIGVAIALGTRDWPGILAETGRWVIVTVFALALLWKGMSADFVTGRFFEWTLLVDARFVPLSNLLGVSSEALALNRELVASGNAGALVGMASAGGAATALTWGTFLVEGAVAVLWALGDRSGNWRHWMLGMFAFITYVIVPVAGFGFMLLVIGAATVKTARGRLAYAAGAAALFVYSSIWTALVL